MGTVKERLLSWGLPLVLVAALILGVVFFSSNEKAQKLPPPSKGKTESQSLFKPFSQDKLTPENQALRDQGLLTLALRSGQASQCTNIATLSLRQICQDKTSYATLLKAGDPAKCLQLFDSELKQSCQNELYTKQALELQNPSFCERITKEDLAALCRNQILTLSPTPPSLEPCSKLSEGRQKKECLEAQALETSLKIGDLLACENLSSSSTKEECQKTISHNQEVLAITQARLKNLPETPQEKLSGCQSLPENLRQNCQDKANFSLAFEQKNLSYCSKISLPQERDRCLSEQGDKIDQFHLRKALSEKNLSECNLITNTELKTLCASSL